MKPFQTYTGGKEASGVYQKIINEIRPHVVFISAFLGNCAITRHKKASAFTYGIDRDLAVIEAWWNMPGIALMNGNCLQLISQLIATHSGSKIVIYFDPPYLLESTKSKKDLYKYSMTKAEHIQFLEFALSLSNVDVIISHYPDELYDKYLTGWRSITFNSQTRSGTAIEKLWMNYNHDSGELHQYDFVGENKDERYNLKHRTAKNLIRKIQGLEPRKKQAIISYMRELL